MINRFEAETEFTNLERLVMLFALDFSNTLPIGLGESGIVVCKQSWSLNIRYSRMKSSFFKLSVKFSGIYLKLRQVTVYEGLSGILIVVNEKLYLSSP